MPPSRSLPPVECCRGTSPIHAAKSRPDLKPPGSATVEAMAVAPITPIPGTVSRRQLHIIGTMMRVNGAIQSSDLQFQSSELIDNSLKCLFHRRWKSFVFTLVRDDRAKLRESFASSLRNEAELGKVGSECVDQLRALTDQKIPRSMQHE